MDKLKLAHEYALEMAKQGIPLKSCKELGWKYADAMQAEAEKRECKGRPDVLWEVDWIQAPDDAIGWVMMQNYSYWHGDEGYLIEDAPSFGFTGSHIVERPNGF